MTELTELVVLIIEDMTCEIHGKKIFDAHILEGGNVDFKACCLDFAEKVNNTIYNTINDYYGMSHLNRKI